MAGSRYWAESYVRLRSGKKFFLSTSLKELQKLMNNGDNTIKVE